MRSLLFYIICAIILFFSGYTIGAEYPQFVKMTTFGMVTIHQSQTVCSKKDNFVVVTWNIRTDTYTYVCKK